MEDSLLRARRYRQRAKEIRIIANDLRGDDQRRKLLAAAKEFDDLASALEAENSK